MFLSIVVTLTWCYKTSNNRKKNNNKPKIFLLAVLNLRKRNLLITF